MRHEFFNSTIASLGLTLALVTAWHQFSPKDDQLTITNEGLVQSISSVQIDIAGIPNSSDMPLMSLIGPVTWKLRLYNPMNRGVSIVSMSVRLLHQDDLEAYYSNMNETLSPVEKPMSKQVFPEGISPYTAKTYFLSLSIPFSNSDAVSKKCTEEFSEFEKIEKCFVKAGRDIFNNKIIYTEYGSTLPEAYSVRYIDTISGPRFKLTFETADGSNFSTIVSYFPFMQARNK